MSKYRYGFSSVKAFGIDPATGLAASGTEVDLTEDILRDTFDFNEEDGTDTEIYSEMDNTPKLSFSEPGKETLTFGQMDTSVEKLALFLGGSVVTGGGGEKTWSKPANAGTIEKRLEIVTLDGYKIIVPRAKVKGLKNFSFRRNGIWTLDLTFTVLTPGFSLAAIDIIEPAP